MDYCLEQTYVPSNLSGVVLRLIVWVYILPFKPKKSVFYTTMGRCLYIYIVYTHWSFNVLPIRRQMTNNQLVCYDTGYFERVMPARCGKAGLDCPVQP